MRIAQIAPCWLAVPPERYGGIELVVAQLADGLTERGHDVTLFASGGSRTKARLVSYYDTPPGTEKLITDPLTELPHSLNAYAQASGFDLIHEHSFPVGASIGAHLARPPVVHTLHGPTTDPRSKEVYDIIGRTLNLVTISDAQRAGAPDLNYVATVYNGIALDRYTMKTVKQDYLLFLGRMSHQKGVHVAVEVARRLGRRLVLAAKIVEPPEKQYFFEQVEPLLTPEVELLGELSHEEKVDLLANAYCTLMPILWPEPFGLVMTESMACGTAVVALRDGSVPEVIDDGVTGFIADDIDEFTSAVDRVGEIDPLACRRRVERYFSTEAMISGYESVYEKIVG